MASKVRVRNKLGGVRKVKPRLAAALVQMGWEYVDAKRPKPKPEPRLEDLTVEELRERAEGLEVEGTGADGNVVKADLIRALQGGYNRRDMRPE